MENNNRTVWIAVAVIVVGVVLCCCLLIVAAAAAGLLTAVPFGGATGVSRVEERLEQTFPVGEEPTLRVDNFAGGITVRRGGAGQIQVTITKQGASQSGLQRIAVDLNELDGGLEIRTSRLGTPVDSASVQVQAVVPDDAELELETKAGTIRIEAPRGEIAARTNAGDVTVDDAVGPVSLSTGAGAIDYAGEPSGRCRFDSGAGSITLRLPTDVDVTVELETGIGTIDLGGFDVEGDVKRTAVDGVIGTGEGATIEASTGAGTITLVPR